MGAELLARAGAARPRGRPGLGPDRDRPFERILDGHGASLRPAIETGVTVIAGSDAGSFGVAHGRGLLRELEQMEWAGMASLDVLNAATGVAAGHLGLADRLGCLRPGRRARLILTERDPLQTVTRLGHEEVRVFDGQVLPAVEDPAGL